MNQTVFEQGIVAYLLLQDHTLAGKPLEYRQWRESNPYSGRKFSILGDSISTLAGFHPQGYNLFYTGEVCDRTGVANYGATWWGKTIDFFGGQLLANSSWSGSTVTGPFPSASSKERIAALSVNETHPDVVLVFMGVNDWARGIPISQEHGIGFAGFYSRMLEDIKTAYPGAEIWCGTLPRTCMSANPGFRFPDAPGGVSVKEYNAAIRTAAWKHKCKVMDFGASGLACDCVDGTHPVAAGMQTLGNLAIRCLGREEINPFLDCPHNAHDYLAAIEETGALYYICRKCGRIRTGHPKRPQKQEEYVMRDPGATRILLADRLDFFHENGGHYYSRTESVIRVGRDPECEVCLKGNKPVSRVHAVFLKEGNTWFLRDEHALNGTWLNGEKILPGVKYELLYKDEVVIAQQEKLILGVREERKKQKAVLPQNPKQDISGLIAAMQRFAASGHKDDKALERIVWLLARVPLYMPMETNLRELSSQEFIHLKKEDVQMKLLTMQAPGVPEFVPVFTSYRQLEKGPEISVIQCSPDQFIPLFRKRGVTVVVDPFSDHRFVLPQEIIGSALIPLLEAQEKPAAKPEFQPEQVLLGKYRLEKQLNRTAILELWQGRELLSGRPLTVQLYDKKARSFGQLYRKKLLQTLQTVQKLNHPGLPQILELVEEEPYILCVRTCREGQTLEELLKKQGTPQEAEVIRWGKCVCGILQYLHGQNPPILCRNICPQNMLLTVNGTVVLTNVFEMKSHTPGEKDTEISGRKGYIPPEQFLGETEPGTDIFALGMTMHYLLTGADPGLGEAYRPVREYNPAISRELEEIIGKCVQPDVKTRFTSAGALLQALQRL